MYFEVKANTSIKIKYTPGVADISRKCDVFYLHHSIGSDTETDYRGAILALTGIYCHFLKTGGRIKRSLTVAGKPSNICQNITDNEKQNGKPVLSIDETKQCISDTLNSLYHFHNRKCNKYEIAEGMGFMIRKLYEPYRNSADKQIHDLFYAVVARGTFVLQINNEIMARAFYKGLYSAWSFAAKKQQYFLGESFWEAQTCYDDLLSRKSIEEDPIHDTRKYPWNLYRYNVDNIILTHCAAKEYIDAAERSGFIRQEALRPYRQVMNLSADFFSSIAAFYKVRCDYFNNRKVEGVEDGRDPIEVYGNVSNTLENYGTLSMEYAPYIFYSCNLFQSTEDRSSWLYKGIAEKFTGKDYKSLDTEYFVFKHIDNLPGTGSEMAKAGMAFMVTSLMSVIMIVGFISFIQWGIATNFFGKVIILWVVIGYFFIMGSTSNYS